MADRKISKVNASYQEWLPMGYWPKMHSGLQTVSNCQKASGFKLTLNDF